MSLDRAAFFAVVRKPLFGGHLTEGQVHGMDAILNEWEARYPRGGDLRWLAYMLATVKHETASTMQAIEEYGRGKGHDYGKPDPDTGKTYYGRGLVQLTWKRNYEAMGQIVMADLVNHPELALSPMVAVQIMFEGMIRGTFTGKKLSDYFSARKDDPVNARRIINALDKAALIAGYHKAFLAALRGAWRASPAPPVAPSSDRTTATLEAPMPIPAAIPVLIDAIRTATIDAVHSGDVPVTSTVPKTAATVIAETAVAKPEVQEIAERLEASTPIPWWQSQTLWSQIIIGVASLLGIAGVTIKPELRDTIIGLAVPFATLVAAVWAAVVRIRSNAQPLTATASK